MDQSFSLISETNILTDGKKFELRELENRFKNSLAKCKIKDMTQLDERMKRIEERIQQYKDEDRNDEVKTEEKYLNALKQLKNLSEEISLKTTLLISQSIDKLDLNELEYRLTYGLEKCKIKDVLQITERIKRSKKRIEQYEDEDRLDTAEQEIKYVRDLEQLQKITEEIFYRKSTEPILKNDDTLQQKTCTEEIVENVSNSRTSRKEENLLDDLVHMPCCAEKTIMELLVDFQQTSVKDCIVEKMPDSVNLKIEKLKDQIQKEELFSEQIKTYFQDLNRAIHNEDCLSTVRVLTNLLKKIRPLHLQEIRRLIEKTKKTAELINDKEIILLVGITGSGKSTTIQFLTGAKMKDTLVEITPGHFLEHITIDGPIRNPGLNNVTSSPLSKSETRYITPVTVKLEDIFGSHDTEEIILCDSPGFGDTAGPEVDIANSVGVIEALKNCNSVKILALSSYRSLGDRGQGILNLVNILINMIDGIQERLYAILYGFTKYPTTVDINALLTNIKTSKVDGDPTLRSNSAVVTVLTDMIDKTKDNSNKIDPIHDKPKNLIKKLKTLKGICYPSEVFRFLMNEETHACIKNQIQKYELSIRCALKHKNIDLVKYYLNNFKFLNDLIKQNFLQDAYEGLIQFINENIQQYCTDRIEKFNRYLISQDGLNDEDIREYKIAHDYIQQIQNLKEYLGSKLVSSKIFIENILSQLEKRNIELQKHDLYSSSIGIYLDNFHLLQNSFNDLELYYKKTCQDLIERFESTLIKTFPELISTNEFKQIAERIFIISKCLPILNHHLNGKIEENYHNIIKSILEHLNKFSDDTNSILMKHELDNDHIKILQDYIILLNSAKETSLLQSQISEYIKNNNAIEITKDLNNIYDEFILKILNYFNEIHLRIDEIIRRNGIDALENIEKLVIQMEMIRTLPNIDTKTARVFHPSIQNIISYMKQLQRDTENLLHTFDQQSGIINFRSLSRSLLRFKKTEWIDRIYPDTYNSMLRHIKEELEERAKQLEQNLIKLNFNLKFPDNIRLANEIIEKIESMNILENTIPEIKIYRERINEYFIKIMNENFDYIKKTYNLTDKTIDHLEKELNEIEQIKNEYDTLYPARNYLRKFGYSNIDILKQKMENLRVQHDIEFKKAKDELRQIESSLDEFSIIDQHYKHLVSSKIDFGIFNGFIARIGVGFQRLDTQPNEYLKQKGYANIEIFKDAMTKIQKTYDRQLQLIEQKLTEFNNSLNQFESINENYISLQDSNSSKEIDFLKEKGQHSYESLEEIIQKKKKILIEYDKYKQIYYFNDKLNASLANNALIYITNCEKIGHHHIKQMAIDMNDFLRKYIEEYGHFLNKEIEKNFMHITNNDEDDSNQYSHDLEKYFEELVSLNKYTFLFESLHGTEKIDYWHRKLFNYHRFLDNNMKEYKISGRNQEFRNALNIAQALGCLDRFCTVILSDNGFRAIHREYQIDIAKITREAYDKAREYISKEDYANADLELSDIVENSAKSKFLVQIKHDLETSLSKIVKKTKTDAYNLNGKIEQVEDNQNKIREINENIDKIRIVLNRHYIMELIDEKNKNILQNFENEINEILSAAILNAIKNIEIFIETNHFLEAEQCMKNLTYAQNGLASFYTSKLIYNKTEELKIKVNSLVSDILQRYDFVDINNYSINPPKELLMQLKRAISGGYAKYIKVSNSLMDKIQINFNQAINKIRENTLNDRSTHIRSIKTAFLYLPEELKPIFQYQIDELNQLSVNQNNPLEFD